MGNRIILRVKAAGV